MPLDPSIVRHFKPTYELPDPLDQQQKVLTLAGLLQQQQARAEEMATERASKQALMNYNGDVEQAVTGLMRAGNYKAAAKLEDLLKFSERRREREDTRRIMAELYGQTPQTAGSPETNQQASLQARIAHLKKLAVAYSNNPATVATIQREIDKLESGAKPLIEHNFSVGENMVQPHVSYDQGRTWQPLPGSKPSAKFAKQVAPTIVNQPAPTMTEVIDPKDPSRLLRVDARQYRGGTLGDVGVLGVSGKEPAAAKREEEKEKGRKQITATVDQLAAYYDDLERMGAVVTPQQPGIKNIYERAAASGIGQTVAGFLGTRAQETRDKIAASRPLLMAAIKQASGMSAQEMNSNVELQFYMQAATDPARSIESNRAALAVLDQTYGLGTGVISSPQAVEALRKAAPKGVSAGAIGSPAPPGVDPKVWAVMTPEERALWQR